VDLKALYNVSEARSLVSITRPAAKHHVADGRRTGARNVQPTAGHHHVNHVEVGPAGVRHVAEREDLPQQHAERPVDPNTRTGIAHIGYIIKVLS